MDFVAPARACDVTEPGADPRARRSAVAAQSGKCSSGQDLRGQANCTLVDVEVGTWCAPSLAACSDSDETSRDALGDVSEAPRLLGRYLDRLRWLPPSPRRRQVAPLALSCNAARAVSPARAGRGSSAVPHTRRWRSAPCAQALGRGRSIQPAQSPAKRHPARDHIRGHPSFDRGDRQVQGFGR